MSLLLSFSRTVYVLHQLIQWGANFSFLRRLNLFETPAGYTSTKWTKSIQSTDFLVLQSTATIPAQVHLALSLVPPTTPTMTQNETWNLTVLVPVAHCLP